MQTLILKFVSLLDQMKNIGEGKGQKWTQNEHSTQRCIIINFQKKFHELGVVLALRTLWAALDMTTNTER